MIEQQLRALVLDIRRKPVPLFNIIPTLDAGATEIEALRARVAEQQRDLDAYAGLVVRVAELEAALRLTRCVLPARDSLPKTQTLVGDVVEAVEKALRLSGNKTEVRNG